MGLAMAATAAIPLSACGSSASSAAGSSAPATGSSAPAAGSSATSGEVQTINWNAGTSGNVLLSIANAKGYFDEVGIKINMVQADANSDSMAMLATGKADVVSNSGTAVPLQQIASGQPFTIFGGHMVTGCMPIIAKKGTVWNGVQDFVGKKVAANPSYFALTGAVMDLGYDPMNDVDWQVYTGYPEAMAAVVRGEADYALMGTGQVQAVKKSEDVDIMCFQSDIMPNYSCCRMLAQTDWLDKNPDLVEKLIVVLLRSQAYYEANKEEAVKIHAKAQGSDEAYVAAFMLDDHYNVNVDPLKASVERAWGILDKTGFLDEQAKTIDIDEHINTELYKNALAEATEKYGSEYADFFDKQQSFFDEQNA